MRRISTNWLDLPCHEKRRRLLPVVSDRTSSGRPYVRDGRLASARRTTQPKIQVSWGLSEHRIISIISGALKAARFVLL